jgi:hypothetical protein
MRSFSGILNRRFLKRINAETTMIDEGKSVAIGTSIDDWVKFRRKQRTPQSSFHTIPWSPTSTNSGLDHRHDPNLKTWTKLRSLQQYGLYLTYQMEAKKKRKSSHSSWTFSWRPTFSTLWKELFKLLLILLFPLFLSNFSPQPNERPS